MDNTNGIINKSMRQNYGEYGVENYYTMVGSSYRNPPFSGYQAMRLCLAWWVHEGKDLPEETPVRILDMAAGSGEATECVLEWWKIRKEAPANVVSSSNVIPRSRAFIPPSRAARKPSSLSPSLGPKAPFPLLSATDPYTVDAYVARTGRSCLPLSFQDLASGEHEFQDETSSQSIDMVICSFALHLVESPSELFALLWELSTKARWLIIISPHKKPEIKVNWGWTLWDVVAWSNSDSSKQAEILRERVHCRIFKSDNL